MIVHKCRECNIELNETNWYSSSQKKSDYLCKECNVKRKQLWNKTNPEKRRAQWTRASRKQRHLSFNNNPECSLYLGVYVAERVLSHVFEDVEQMPNGNPGYDLICNRGKKIDVKSSCLHKDGGWDFNINCNLISDYFLCLAFDNRKDLNPLHIWLIPGGVVNSFKGVSIRSNTIHKWDKYRLDISKVSACCDVMRSH